MAAGCFIIRGFSATVRQAAGLIVPFKSPVRSFHSSRWSLGEQQTKQHPCEQVYENVEYIPQRKAKNPMKAVAIAWAIGFPSGIILFLLTKREVEKNRLKQLKVRQKIKASNEGEYERIRYRTSQLDNGGSG